MAKDPSFLFYSKDWLEGTAEMLPEEKGVYIDLLCHQHQKGNLPSDTTRLARLTGLSHEEFMKIWAGISCKFIPDGNRIANAKLTDVVTERKTNAWQNTIISNWAVIIRAAEIPADVKQKIKKQFKVKDFLTETPETITERLTEWFNERLKEWLPFLEDENAIAIEDENENKIKKGGAGENKKTELTDAQVKQVIEFAHITLRKKYDTGRVKELWDAFMIQNKDAPSSGLRNEKYRHFLNWLKFLKDDNNGNKSNSTQQQHDQLNSIYAEVKSVIGGSK